jgi:hypothetical protein
MIFIQYHTYSCNILTPNNSYSVIMLDFVFTMKNLKLTKMSIHLYMYVYMYE